MLKHHTLSLLLLVFTSLSLHSDLKDFFSKCPNKGESHRLKNIDFIYLINLDKRPEKLIQTINELKPFNIHPYRVSAVNGWDLKSDQLNQLGVLYLPQMNSEGLWGTSFFGEQVEYEHSVINQPNKVYFCHCMSRGAIGCVLSHLSVISDAIESGYETIWVIEDDIEVIKDPNILPKLIDILDRIIEQRNLPKWDILFTDRDTRNSKGEYIPALGFAKRPNFRPYNTTRFSVQRNIHPLFRSIGARYGTYSMIIRKSGMHKIMDHYKKYNIFLPYDMELILPNDIHLYTVREDIVAHRIDHISDNGAPPP